jgi:hypothetical protein
LAQDEEPGHTDVESITDNLMLDQFEDNYDLETIYALDNTMIDIQPPPKGPQTISLPEAVGDALHALYTDDGHYDMDFVDTLNNSNDMETETFVHPVAYVQPHVPTTEVIEIQPSISLEAIEDHSAAEPNILCVTDLINMKHELENTQERTVRTDQCSDARLSTEVSDS